jgi:hypothetical protein
LSGAFGRLLIAMFTIILKDTITGTEERHEFENAKLAKIYRDYHLNFGHWNGKAKWMKDSDILEENRKFICDEMTKIENGEITHYFYVTDGLIIEECVGDKTDSFIDLRIKRDKLLRESDWTQLADVVMSQDERKQYRVYRQYLRDLPKLHNEISVLSADVYCFEDWKMGKR